MELIIKAPDAVQFSDIKCGQMFLAHGDTVLYLRVALEQQNAVIVMTVAGRILRDEAHVTPVKRVTVEV